MSDFTSISTAQLKAEQARIEQELRSRRIQEIRAEMRELSRAFASQLSGLKGDVAEMIDDLHHAGSVPHR